MVDLRTRAPSIQKLGLSIMACHNEISDIAYTINTINLNLFFDK
jgi:hypothetical protein